MQTRNKVLVAVLIIIICLMGLLVVNQTKKIEDQRAVIKSMSEESVAPTTWTTAPTPASSTPSVVVPQTSGHTASPVQMQSAPSPAPTPAPTTPTTGTVEPGQDHTPGVHGNFYTDEQGNIYPLMTPHCYRSASGRWLNIAPPHEPCMAD